MTQIQVDKDNYITSYSTKGGFLNGIQVSDLFKKYLDSNKLGYLKFNGADNPPIFDEEKYNRDKKNNLIEELRTKRESECFPIINRGKLWYDTLTQEQVEELQTWYQAWLDVTVTLKVPIKPDWIK